MSGTSRRFPRRFFEVRYSLVIQQERVYPTSWARGLRDQSKNGRSRPRKPFISRVFCAQRGIETMVSEGARPWGGGRFGDCEQ